MKRVLSIFLLLAMVLILVSCGESSGGKNNNSENNSTNGEDTTPTQAEQSTSDKTEQEELPSSSSSTELTNEPFIITEKDGVTITFNGLYGDDYGRIAYKVLIENNTLQDIVVRTKDTVVNGYMIGDACYIDISANKKANDLIYFDSSDLEASGIDTITDFQTTFIYCKSDGWDEIGSSERISIITDNYGTYVQEHDTRGDIITDSTGVKVIQKSMRMTSDGDFLVDFYAENNSEYYVSISSRDVSLSGFMVDGVLSVNILPGARAVFSMTVPEYELAANGLQDISSLTDLQYTLVGRDSDWNLVFETEPIEYIIG